MTAAGAGGVPGVGPLRQVVCLPALTARLPPSRVARDWCAQGPAHAGRHAALPMAPRTPAAAGAARAAGRCRPTTPALSGPDPARAADHVVVGGLGAEQAPAPGGETPEVCSVYRSRVIGTAKPAKLSKALAYGGGELLWQTALGLGQLSGQSYEATAKGFAVVFVALAFFQWRLHHAPYEHRWRSLADVVRQQR